MRGCAADDFDGRTEGLIALSGGAGRIERALARAMRRAARDARGCGISPSASISNCSSISREQEAQRNRSGAPRARSGSAVRRDQRRRLRATKSDAQLADVLLACKQTARRWTQARPPTAAASQRRVSLKDRPRMMAPVRASIPQAVASTLAIARALRVSAGTAERAVSALPGARGQARRSRYLRELVYAGRCGALRDRRSVPKVERQLEYELGIIAQDGSWPAIS